STYASRRQSTRLLVLHLGELRVNDVLFLLRLGARRFSLRISLGRSLLLLLRGVDLFAELLRRLRQRLSRGVDLRLVVGLEDRFGVLQRRLDLVLLAGVDLVAVVLDRFSHGVDQRLALVARVDQLEGLLVFLGMRLGILHHALDLGLGQARAR